jgi:hypothetical protein
MIEVLNGLNWGAVTLLPSWINAYCKSGYWERGMVNTAKTMPNAAIALSIKIIK